MSAIGSRLLLKETIRLMLESPSSDAFEQEVTKAINNKFKGQGIKAVRPPPNVKIPDVLVTVKGAGESFIEVKMNHTDNLSNIRVHYANGQWYAGETKSPVAGFVLKLLNASPQAAAFIEALSKFTRTPNVKVIGLRGAMSDPTVVNVKVMKKFLATLPDANIIVEPGLNIGELVTAHYTQGKDAPAYYLQASDDFYLISGADPFGLNGANGGGIPTLGGTGTLKVRVSSRSAFYEVMVQTKIDKFNPASSPFSVRKGSKKANPFSALVGDAVTSNEPRQTSRHKVK